MFLADAMIDGLKDSIESQLSAKVVGQFFDCNGFISPCKIGKGPETSLMVPAGSRLKKGTGTSQTYVVLGNLAHRSEPVPFFKQAAGPGQVQRPGAVDQSS